MQLCTIVECVEELERSQREPCEDTKTRDLVVRAPKEIEARPLVLPTIFYTILGAFRECLGVVVVVNKLSPSTG